MQDWTAAGIARAVGQGTVRPSEVVAEAFARITRLGGRVGAFQHLLDEQARADAAALDGRGDLADLPLAGVPIAVKDNIPVAGAPLRNGSLATSPDPVAADHEVVRRLRAAGAVVVGITRVPELCVWPMTDGPFGTARNPWDPARTPGGSSGGSASAVAAGLVPVAIGNDGLGSIRIPAACCGLAGIKPGHGVVPSGLGHDAGTWFDMAENGPLATTVTDAALVLAVLAGRPELATPAEPAGLRIAVSTRSPVPGSRPRPEWVQAAERTADVLRGLGHRVEAADPPYSPALVRAAVTRWTAGTAEDAAGLDAARLQRRTRVHAALGRAAVRAHLLRESDRARFRAAGAQFFAAHDVLLTPALYRTPPRADGWYQRGWLANYRAASAYAPHLGPWNVAQYPAAVVPAGRAGDGLPLAVQLVAADGGEARLLGVMAQLERAAPWPRTAPLEG